MSTVGSTGDSDGKDGMTGAQIEQLTRQSTIPITVHERGVFAGVDSDGRVHINATAVAELDALEPAPRRKQGVRRVDDAPSFVAYVLKHGDATKDGSTEVYANVKSHMVTAVLDGDSAKGPGWGEHQVILGLRNTTGWIEWIANSGKWMDQLTMAEHFEDHRPDFLTPTGADILEMAQTFKATQSGAFESSQRLQSGATTLNYRKDVDATAQNAAKQQVAIPDGFTLQLSPFEGSTDAYKVECRFRYRISEGKLRLLYKVQQPDDIVRAAFADVVAGIAEGIPQPIWAGSGSPLQ